MSRALRACRRCRTVIVPGQNTCLRCGAAVDVTDAPEATGQVGSARSGTDPADEVSSPIWAPDPIPHARISPQPSPQPSAQRPRESPTSEPTATPPQPPRPAAAETLDPDRTASFSPPRAVGRRAALLGGALVVALVAAVVGIGVLPGRLATPEKAVEGFFGALADRDLDAARGYFYFSANDPNSPPDITDLTLAPLDTDGYRPPTELRVTGVNSDDVLSGYIGDGYFPQDAAYAQVAFTWTVGAEQFKDSVFLVRPDGANPYRPWRLYLMPPTISASTTSSSPPSVNGEPMLGGAEGWGLSALPGSYQVELAPSAAYTSDPQTATVALTEGASVTLARTIRSDVEAAVTEEVEGYLDGCTLSTDPVPEDCPFYANSWFTTIPDTVTWSIDSYPTIALSEADGDSSLLVSSSLGVARASDPASGDLVDETSFSVSGIATLTDTGVTFSPQLGD